MAKQTIAKLRKAVGFSFRNKKLIEAALTHPSYRNECVSVKPVACFQRLEFLGDSVLNFFIARRLYKLFPDADEGLLSRLRSILVSRRVLAKIGKTIKLHRFLDIGKHEKKQFSLLKEKILADSFEALVAAIYYDRGLKKTEEFLAKHFNTYFDQKKLFRIDPNPKSTLQEYVQKELHILPSYEIGHKEKHQFTAWVSIHGKMRSKGKGRTLKEAEAKAAAGLIKKLRSGSPLRKKLIEKSKSGI